METLFINIVKSSGLIATFFLAYYLLLRKETFFTANRWFLLAGLLTSVILPWIVFTTIVWVEPTPTHFDWSKVPTQPTQKESFEINWDYVMLAIYSIGFLVFIIKFAIDLYSLNSVLRGKKIQQQADFKLIDTTENIAPFSYFKTIVYNSSLYSESEMESILEHEKVHSEQYHTVDVLITRFFCVLFWFNPFIWLYKNAILQNLEFIADNEAAKKIPNKKAYQLTLLKITTHENCVVLTNHFYQSLIKKRIVMLNKNQSKKWNSWKYALVIPALIAFVFLFQIEVIAQEKETPKQESKANTSPGLTSSKIDENLNALAEEKEIYINGEKSNKEELDKLDPNEIKSIDVINKKANKPTLLIVTKNVSKTIKITSNNDGKLPNNNIPDDTKIFINGAESSKAEMQKLNPEEIESMNVINSNGKKEIRIFTKKWLKSSEEFTFYIDDKKVTPQEFYICNPAIIESSNGNLDEKTLRIITKKDVRIINDQNKPVPPTPPTPPNLKMPKSLVFPKAPTPPKGNPQTGDKKAWNDFEKKMEEYDAKMKKLEPQMEAFDKQMAEFDKQMEEFDKKMKVYEKQVKDYQ